MTFLRVAAATLAILLTVPAGVIRAAEAPLELSLRECLERLPTTNRSVKVARGLAEVAAAEVRRADVGPNPTLAASVSNAIPRHYRPGDADWIVRLEQTFERGGKREARVALARAQAAAARLDILEVTRQQRLLAAGAYFDLIGAQRAVVLARETLDTHERLLVAARRRLSAGDLAAVDVARLAVEEGRARNEVRTAESNLQQSRLVLAAVLGLDDDAPRLQATDEFLPLEPEPADEADLDARLARRADLAALGARLEALEHGRRLALAQRTRDVTVGVQTERSPSLGGRVYGVSASVPLFINNDYSGDIVRAQTEIDALREERDRVRAQARIDVARARELTQSALDRARRLETQSLPEARRAVEAIEFAFSRGAATLTDLFDARRQWVAVRVESLTARSEHSKALISWRESLRAEEPSR